MTSHDQLPPKSLIGGSGPSILERGIVCSFSCGTYRVSSPSGKTGLLFDDSDQFGPSVCHPRTGDLTEISARLNWFWDWYPSWRTSGRPTTGMMTSPIGDIWTAAITPPDRVSMWKAMTRTAREGQ